MKVIRLVTRHSVEEMVLKRAMAKLQMTSTVIEGGQVYKEKLVFLMCIYVPLCSVVSGIVHTWHSVVVISGD